MTKKKFFLDQHGCAKNQVDAELIYARLEALGFIATDNSSDADLIVINSCGFIESAKEESLSSLMLFRSSCKNAKILLTGCLAERYAEVFKTQLPEADGILGNGDISKIDQTVASLFKDERPVLKFEQKGVCCGERTKLFGFPGSAYVKITEGCNNCCSFCAIPLIRGQLRSRKVQDIFEEIKLLVSRGIYEINLIGQDLAAFGTGNDDDKSCDLAALIEKISEVKGNFVVRLLYIHPDHFNKNILSAMKKDKRFLPYFDIPFQSGSNQIIKSMNRHGTKEKYIELVNDIRSVFPEAAIRTTFLTGFPGETKEDAEETKDFLLKIKSDWSGCFAYSREDDTLAYNFKNRVAHKIALQRSEELCEIQKDITQEKLKSRTGKIYDVLVEEIIENKTDTDEGLAIGRTWFEAPEVDGNIVIRYDLCDKNAVEQILPGKVVKVRADSSSEFDLDGVFCAK